MCVPTSEVGYTSATNGRGDHEVHKGHVVGGIRFLKKHSRYNRKKELKKQNSYTDLPFQVFLPRTAKPYILLPFGKMIGQFLHLEARNSL
jgi:hypothetical protein